MKIKRCLYGPGHPAGPTRGKDVEIVKSVLNRYESGNFFPKPPAGYDDVYNAKTAEAIRIIQEGEAIWPHTGNTGQRTFDFLWENLFHAYDKWRYGRFTVPVVKPALIEPYQGFGSLDSSLWEIYTLGREMGLNDGPGYASGTYNPGSTLPSGAPSDHAVGPPAFAFDLDIGPDTGFQNVPARNFFWAATHDPRVEYVILGYQIWSQSQGLHSYGSGDHMNHVHVSGIR